MPREVEFCLQEKLIGLGSVAKMFQSYFDTFSNEQINDSGKSKLLYSGKVPMSAHKHFVSKKGLTYEKTTNIYRIP